ncbi:unnamed protein product, partial [Scytosiphon promiscuus]
PLAEPGSLFLPIRLLPPSPAANASRSQVVARDFPCHLSRDEASSRAPVARRRRRGCLLYFCAFSSFSDGLARDSRCFHSYSTCPRGTRRIDEPISVNLRGVGIVRVGCRLGWV